MAAFQTALLMLAACFVRSSSGQFLENDCPAGPNDFTTEVALGCCTFIQYATGQCCSEGTFPNVRCYCKPEYSCSITITAAPTTPAPTTAAPTTPAPTTAAPTTPAPTTAAPTTTAPTTAAPTTPAPTTAAPTTPPPTTAAPTTPAPTTAAPTTPAPNTAAPTTPAPTTPAPTTTAPTTPAPTTVAPTTPAPTTPAPTTAAPTTPAPTTAAPTTPAPTTPAPTTTTTPIPRVCPPLPRPGARLLGPNTVPICQDKGVIGFESLFQICHGVLAFDDDMRRRVLRTVQNDHSQIKCGQLLQDGEIKKARYLGQSFDIKPCFFEDANNQTGDLVTFNMTEVFETYLDSLSNDGCLNVACFNNPAIGDVLDYGNCNIYSYGATDVTNPFQTDGILRTIPVAVNQNPFKPCSSALPAPESSWSTFCFRAKNSGDANCNYGDSYAPVFCNVRDSDEEVFFGFTAPNPGCAADQPDFLVIFGYEIPA